MYEIIHFEVAKARFSHTVELCVRKIEQNLILPVQEFNFLRIGSIFFLNKVCQFSGIIQKLLISYHLKGYANLIA